MIIKNFLKTQTRNVVSHDGVGTVIGAAVYKRADFDTPIKFFHYTQIPPLSSIGYHTHGDDEEIYAILEGRGIMTVNGESVEVAEGDVILNKPGWSHGLENHTNEMLKLLVIGADKKRD